MTHLHRLIPICLVVASLVGAAPAAAGKATRYGGVFESFFYKAAFGERNDVSLERLRSSHPLFLIRDVGAPVKPRDYSCKSRTRHAVVCEGGTDQGDSVELVLRDGDDRADLAGAGSSLVRAGGGDDVIHGTRHSDTLRGYAGSDRLYGLGGDDFLKDGSATSSAGGRDLLDGGPGSDRVSYSMRRLEPLTIDLTTGRGPGGDRLESLEEAFTGRGDDTITGNAADNWIGAGGGTNVVRGLRGDDELSLAAGGTLDGGAGDDELTVGARRQQTTAIACGDGDDSVSSYPADRVQDDCEFVVAGDAAVDLTAYSRDGRVLHFPAQCSNSQYCEGTLELHREDGTLASSTDWEVEEREAPADFVRFELSQADADLLAAGALFTVRPPDARGRGFTALLKG